QRGPLPLGDEHRRARGAAGAAGLPEPDGHLDLDRHRHHPPRRDLVRLAPEPASGTSDADGARSAHRRDGARGHGERGGRRPGDPTEGDSCMNKKILFGGLLLIVPTLLLFAMSFGKDTRTVRSPLVGREAPPFTLRTLEDGSAFSLAQLKGKPAVVNFWA